MARRPRRDGFDLDKLTWITEYGDALQSRGHLMAPEVFTDDGPSQAQVLRSARRNKYSQERHIPERNATALKNQVHVVKSLSGLLTNVSGSDHCTVCV